MNRKCELVASGVYQVWAGQGSAVNKSVWKPHTEPQRPPWRSSWRQVSPSVRLHLLLNILVWHLLPCISVGFQRLTSRKKNGTVPFPYLKSNNVFQWAFDQKRAIHTVHWEDIKTRLLSWNWPFWLESHSRHTHSLENPFMHPDRVAKWYRGTEEMQFPRLITLTTDCGRR